MKKTFEIVSFLLSQPEKERAFLEASRNAESKRLSNMKGFIERSLLKDSEGRFCDVVTWESIEDAKAAMDAVMQCEDCLKMFSFIDKESINMNHYTEI